MNKIVRDAYCVEGLDVVYLKPLEMVREFMLKLTEQMSIEIERRMKFAGHAAFLLNRDQLLVVLAQAAAKVTDTFLLMPMATGTRRPAKWEAFTGAGCNVDLWAMYKGVTFLVNIANDMASIASSRVKKKIVCSWTEMINRFEAVEQEAKDRRLHHGVIVRIGLYVLPLYQTIKGEGEQLIDDEYVVSNIKRKIQERLEPVPNWSARWITGVEEIYEYEDRKEMYHAVIYMGSIKQISDNSKTDFRMRLDPTLKVRQSRRRVFVGSENTYYKYHRLVSVKPDVQVYS
jgi:hypothetical protein